MHQRQEAYTDADVLQLALKAIAAIEERGEKVSQVKISAEVGMSLAALKTYPSVFDNRETGHLGTGKLANSKLLVDLVIIRKSCQMPTAGRSIGSATEMYGSWAHSAAPHDVHSCSRGTGTRPHL